MDNERLDDLDLDLELDLDEVVLDAPPLDLDGLPPVPVVPEEPGDEPGRGPRLLRAAPEPWPVSTAVLLGVAALFALLQTAIIGGSLGGQSVLVTVAVMGFVALYVGVFLGGARWLGAHRR